MNTLVAYPSLLIIDDDGNQSSLCTKVLSKNFKIATCEDGQEALARLTTHIPDLVVLDLNLPRVSGRTILKRLRSDGRFSDTKVVILSADIANSDESVLQDADLVLYKPISPYDLKQMCILLSQEK